MHRSFLIRQRNHHSVQGTLEFEWAAVKLFIGLIALRHLKSFLEFKGIDDLPVFFHIHNRPSFCICLI
jgi:hypothetical protein